jgi:hypothetical protein
LVFFSADRHLSELMGATDHHRFLLPLPKSGTLQTLQFLSNPSSRCGYFYEKKAPPYPACSTIQLPVHAASLPDIDTCQFCVHSENQSVTKWQSAIILFFVDSAVAATDGDHLEGLSGREGFGTRAARSLWEERTG